MANEEFDKKQNIEEEFDIFKVNFKDFLERYISGIPNFLKRGGGQFFIIAFLRIIMCIRQIVDTMKELKNAQESLQKKFDNLMSQDTCSIEPFDEPLNSLDDKSFQELKTLAKEIGINTYKMKRADIKVAIEETLFNG